MRAILMDTMVDDVVKRILKEAETREGTDAVGRIYAVCREIDAEIISIMDNMRAEERKKNG